MRILETLEKRILINARRLRRIDRHEYGSIELQSSLPVPELANIQTVWLIGAATWMAICYGAWLWLRIETGEHSLAAVSSVVIGFGPFMLWGLLDYRMGLLLTVVATPFLVAPPVPHGFTQGFGDLLAVCTVIGYLVRNPIPKKWIRLWRSSYIWLVFVLIVATVSLLAAPSPDTADEMTIKHGLAEIAGYCLAFAYLVLLVGEIKSMQDGYAVLLAIGVAVLVTLCYVLVSAEVFRTCVGGYYGSAKALSSNQGIASTFGSTNYHASYILATLPLALLVYLRSRFSRLINSLSLIVVVLLVFGVQASLSRAGLLGLLLVWLGWLVATRWRAGTRMMSILLGMMLPLSVLVWWYPGCACNDAPPWVCTPLYIAKQEVFRQSAEKQKQVEQKQAEQKQPEQKQAEQKQVEQKQAEQKQAEQKQVEQKQVEQKQAEQKQAEQKSIALAQGIVVAAVKHKLTPKGNSDATRLQLINNAIAAWRDHPLTGVGVGLMSNYSIAGQQSNRAHNMVLTLLAEQGLFGVIAWGGWWLALALIFWRQRQDLFQRGHPAIFLFTSFVTMTMISMFADQYRVIWLWQLSALIVSFSKMKPDKGNIKKSA